MGRIKFDKHGNVKACQNRSLGPYIFIIRKDKSPESENEINNHANEPTTPSMEMKTQKFNWSSKILHSAIPLFDEEKEERHTDSHQVWMM